MAYNNPPPNPIMEEEYDDGPTCPLCLEELDTTDRAVEACHCGYQVCLWCLHHIREQLNSRCPACRTPYQEQNFKYAEVNHEEAAKEAIERATAKKERERREKIREIEKERARAAAVSQQKAKNNLKHARILQKNLVYVIGLSLTLAREDIIRRADMFGKFGRLTRILVNRSHPFNTDAPGGPSISAYVQYVRDSDASAAVRAMNNAVLDGREIHCAIATTKYCDAYVRNAAASDPNAAHFCGNHNCMYYHSLSQEPTLTGEEVLARQLGPPPPAHLFLPADTRRIHPSMRMPHSSPAPSGRPIPSRPVINAAPTMGPGSSASAIHLPSASLPNSSAPIINPPLHSVSSSFPSPLPSPRHHPPYLARKPLNTTSPHRTPPSSPLAVRASVSNINRSPRAQESLAHRVPLSSQTSAPPSTSSRLLSTSGWDNSNAGQGVSRPPPRSGASVALDDPLRSHTRGQIPVSRENAPPGFDEPSSPTGSSSVLSRPPGFDGPKASRTAIDSGTDHDAARRENGRQPPSSIAPPPGFGPGPVVKKDTIQETASDVAAAWSQEASSDQVFLAKARRVKGGTVGQVGQVGTRHTPVAQDDPNARSELAQVLAKIGGDLGVSSEFQDVHTSSSFPIISRKSQPSSDAIGIPGSSQRLLAKPGPLDSLFGSQMSSNTYTPSSPHQSVPSVPKTMSDRIGPYSSSQAFDTRFSSPLVRDPFPAARSEVPLGTRRSNSRFGFAREDSPEKSSASAPQPSVSLPLPPSSTMLRPIEPQGNRHGQTGQFRAVDSSSSLIRGQNEVSQAQALKPPQLSGRQARSRFDFADQGSSPPKAPPMLQANSRVNLMPPRVGVPFTQASPPSSTAPLVNDAFIMSFAQLSREEKLASLFNSAQWSADQLPPMPTVSTQLDSTIPLNTTSTSKTESVGSSEVNYSSLRIPSVPNRHHTAQPETNERVPLTAGSRAVQFTPPGFREATPGNTPETSVVDSTSASSGVATTVASGGVVSTTTSTKDNNISNDASDLTSSGAESVEDDRKRSRAQRKRDKKARQSQEAVAGKMSSTASEPVPKSTQPLHITQQVETTRSAQIPQPAQRHAGQTVIPIQPLGPDPSIPPSSAVQTQTAAEEAVPASKEQATVVPSPDRLHAVRDPMQDANIPIPNLQQNDAGLVVVPSKGNDENDKYMSVSELEKEIEAARAREAQLQDKLLELQRRIRSYDNIRT